jgi:hypothetical protein
MSLVQDWLDGDRDFAAGVKLYAEHGGKAFYLTMFDKAGPTDYNRAKLLAELTKLAGSEPAPAPILKKPVTKPPPSLKPTPDKAADNRKYLDLVRRKKDLYTQLNMLMMEKQFLPAGEKLRVCAFDIIKTHQAIVENWALLDHYQEHQSFPSKPAKPMRDDKTEAQYLRQAISRAKSRLKSPNCRDRTATALLLKQKENELAELLTKPQE